MMLANIMDGRHFLGGGDLKTTLIVATPALVDQWKTEIEKHCIRGTGEKKLRVLRFIGASKLQMRDDEETSDLVDVMAGYE